MRWCLLTALILLTGCATTVRGEFKDAQASKLLIAALDGDEAKAERLAKEGANVNAITDDGATPLIFAVNERNLDAANILLKLGANPNEFRISEVGEAGDFDPPVWKSAWWGEKAMLNALLNHGGDPNQTFGTHSALMMAVAYSHLDCAELLLTKGADINLAMGPVTALTEAMTGDQFDNVIWVLDHGYTHDLPMARKLLEISNPRPEQAALRVQALAIVDRLISQQGSNGHK